MKAYYKDIWRAIKENRKRFFSLMLITILGVTMLTGLRAACRDLRYTADVFYDKQNLYDICVVSTLGLTDDDVEALAALEEIELAEGTYTETVKVWIGEQNKSAEVKQIGDTVILDEEEESDEEAEEVAEPNFKVAEYTITGTVIDPMNVNSLDEMMAFRSNTSTDYTFFVLPEAVESDIYTAVYLTVKDCDGLMCYDSGYGDRVQGIVDRINVELKEVRQQARYDEITGEALSELADADCIESVGRAFPIIFFIVAILIGLTTITRMVEEERGLIGTYKALGFTDREIRRKYMLYASGASIIGGIIGDICGFIVLPKIIFSIFAVLYQLPEYQYTFDMVYGIGGVVLFAGGIILATWAACEAELHHMPATLMRPKAPKAGSRVFLERVAPVWSKLFNFLYCHREHP